MLKVIHVCFGFNSHYYTTGIKKLAPLSQQILNCSYVYMLCAGCTYLLPVLIDSLNCLCPFVIGQCGYFCFDLTILNQKSLCYIVKLLTGSHFTQAHQLHIHPARTAFLYTAKKKLSNLTFPDISPWLLVKALS